MIRVLHVCKVYLPTRGGVQEVIGRICNGLKKEIDFEVLTTAESNAIEREPGIVVNRKKATFELRSMPFSMPLIISLWANLKKFNYVCCHYPFPLIDIAIALYPRRLSNIIIYWHSEIVSQKVFGFFVRPFTKIMLYRAESIVVSSPELIKHSKLLSKHYAKCVVIPFGLGDLTKTKDAAIHQQRKSDKLMLVSVGRHVEYKGFDVLLNAIVGLKCELTIVGDGPLLENHKQLAETLGVNNSVTFLDQASDDRVAVELYNSDVFILSSKLPSEAFALVQIEAMCYGKPIINTNLRSGVPWVARHGQEGLTVKPNDSCALNEAIRQLAEDRVLMKKLGENARLRYLSEFSLGNFLVKTNEIYHS